MTSNTATIPTPSTTPQVARYGSWKSPITSDLIVADSISLMDVQVDGAEVYWVEGRPKEGGRYVVVRRGAEGAVEDVTPAAFNARTRVHEYGGGAVLVVEGVVFFSNYVDQKLYRQDPATAPRIISRNALCRYADAVLDLGRNRLVCVREDHSAGSAAEAVVNTLVEVAADGLREETVLVSGHDFYSNPRISPDGRRMAWLAWNHPEMPWTANELWLGELGPEGEVVEKRRIAGNGDESIFQPEWSPEGVLHFVSDRSGWWNLYRWSEEEQAAPLRPMEAEFGQPQWVFGMSTYGFLTDGSLACTWSHEGRSHLGIRDTAGQWREIAVPYTDIGLLRTAGDKILLLAGAPDQPYSVCQLAAQSGELTVLQRSTELMEDAALRAYVSTPTLVEFPSGNRKAYGWYYPPHNPNFTSVDERPPLIVKSHGGPTASASSVLSLRTQFWTSRGYAVMDVDYGGSTGYGREYRNRLHRAWGVVDLEDCTNAALHLAENKLADRERMAITGGSAGGYTTLCALTFTKVFRTGASHFGVADIAALARDTHKFESRYMDWLVGKYPEEKDVYEKRSPVHFTDQLSVPVIFFQGSEDEIVPPNQAEMMVEAIRKKGLPVEYFLFDGEQHGFRKAENIKRSLDAELYFYSALMVRAGLRW